MAIAENHIKPRVESRAEFNFTSVSHKKSNDLPNSEIQNASYFVMDTFGWSAPPFLVANRKKIRDTYLHAEFCPKMHV